MNEETPFQEQPESLPFDIPDRGAFDDTAQISGPISTTGREASRERVSEASDASDPARDTQLSPAAFAPDPPRTGRNTFTKVLYVSAIALLALAASGYTLHAVFFNDSVAATGYLQPHTTTPLNFPNSAAVVAIGARPGDIVKKGQVLAKQDVTALQAQLAADQQALAADEALVSYAQNPTAAQETKALQLAVAASQAQLDAARVKAADVSSVHDSTLQSLQNNIQAAQATLASDQRQAAAAAQSCAEAGAPLGTQVNGSAAGAATIAHLDRGHSVAAPSPPPPAGSDATSSSTTGPSSTTTPSTAPIIPPPTTDLSPAGRTALINSCTQLAHRIAQDQSDVVSAQGTFNEALNSQRLAVNSANADVGTAQNGLDTANSKLAAGTLPETTTLASAQAAVNRDKAKIAADQKAIADSVITAPYDGVITNVGGVEGAIAGPSGVRQFSSPQPLPQKDSSGIQLFPSAPQQSNSAPHSDYVPLMTLASTEMEVVAQVGETHLSKLRNGDKAHITFPALRGVTVTGVIERIEPQAVNVDGKVYFLVDLALLDPPPSLATRPELAVNRPGHGRSSGNPLSSQVVGLSANVTF